MTTDYDMVVDTINSDRIKMKDLKDQQYHLRRKIEKAEQQIVDGLVRGHLKGKRFRASMVTVRRSIGKPDARALHDLEFIDERLVRRIPGAVHVQYGAGSDDMMRRITGVVTEMGLESTVDEPITKPETLKVVDMVLKERHDITGRHIFSLLDLQEKQELVIEEVEKK